MITTVWDLYLSILNILNTLLSPWSLPLSNTIWKMCRDVFLSWWLVHCGICSSDFFSPRNCPCHLKNSSAIYIFIVSFITGTFLKMKRNILLASTYSYCIRHNDRAVSMQGPCVYGNRGLRNFVRGHIVSECPTTPHPRYDLKQTTHETIFSLSLSTLPREQGEGGASDHSLLL